MSSPDVPVQKAPGRDTRVDPDPEPTRHELRPDQTVPGPKSRKSSDTPELPERYGLREVLGVGGMGKVLLCEDQRIGRRVAVKIIRPDLTGSEPVETRFIREARVQGQLEHPSMVPVYDIGVDGEGSFFFTMKRVRGVTLKEILSGLRRGEPELKDRYSRRRLLTAFSSVCLAVDFAHRHGVLHRDIKPGNIMLGDFGEVYVLDWGIAKVIGSDTVAEPEGQPPTEGSDRRDSIDTDGPTLHTSTGAMLGTLGFMSPEQIEGDPGALQPASDVYGLGAVLFQILTLERLHPRAPEPAMLARTIAGVEARPSVRAPESQVAPELESICVRATATDPARRFPTARALHEELERFLDGERNEEIRRELAEKHARAAMQAAEEASTEQGMPIEDRRQAMRDVGRALALDPENEAALQAMVRLLTEPTRELPVDVQHQLTESVHDEVRWTAGFATMSYLSLFLYLPLLFAAGIRQPPAIATIFSLGGLSLVLSFLVSRMRQPDQTKVFFVYILSTTCFASAWWLYGPLVLTPGIIAANTAAYAILFRRGWRLATIAVGCLAVALPTALEALGLVTASYRFTAEGMVVVPQAIGLSETTSILILAVAGVATVITGSYSITRLKNQLTEAQRQLLLNNWLIRQLVPAAAPTEPTAPQRASVATPR